MPINLLTEKTTESTKDRVNLLPEITGVFNDSNGSVDVPEVSPQEPFIMDVKNAFMSGLAGTWATAARVPAGIYDLAALPQNFLVKSIGRSELQVQSPEWLMDNPVAELYDYQTQLYREEISPTKTLEEAFETKDFDGIGRHIALQVVENAPQQIGLILSYMAGYPNAGLAGMGLMSSTDVLREGRKNKQDPAMNAYNALASGVIEAGFESIGTMGILKKWGGVLTKSFGTKRGLALMGDVFKTVFHSMLGEGNEEFWTSLAQDFSSFATGTNNDAMKGSLVRAFEAGMVGAVSGAALTGPGAIRVGAKSASVRKMQDSVDASMETLRKEQAAREVSDVAVEDLETSPETSPTDTEIEAVELITDPVVTVESIQPTADKQTALEKEIEAMKFREDKVVTSERAIELGESIHDKVKGTLGILTKEKGIPRIKVSEALIELNAEAGTNFKTIKSLREFEKNWKSEKAWLERIISEVKPELIARKETTILKDKIRNIERGVREGKVIAKEEVKDVQDSVIKRFKAADLAIPVSIKNIQTQEQLTRALPAIKQTIARLEAAATKRDVSANIKKELKSTKPVKKGQKRVGKFDYESNKFFDVIRDFNKLTQEKAQEEFDGYPEEVTSETDLIKKRFLSLKANGASASVEIHEQVLKDIQRVKALGKQAKDEADLEKRLNRQEKVESALLSIGRIRANRKTIKTKIGNLYRQGFSNISSMLNSIGGKAFAEANNPMRNELHRNTATFKKTLDITREAAKVYNEQNIMKLFESMSRIAYEITDVQDGLTTELSKLDLIDIYNAVKNEKTRNDYYEAYGKEQVENLIGILNLTNQDNLFGDLLQESVQAYRGILNKRNIEITGRDMGFVENYWPGTSEFQVSVLDDLRVQGETPSALKERAKGRVIPKPTNAWYKAQKHIGQAEHVDKISREYEGLKRLFTDRKVKHAVTQKFGKDVYATLMAQIDNISLNRQTEMIDAVSRAFQKAINNWVTAKIALNPSTYVRQLMSVGNYSENMNVAEWTTGFFKGMLTPKETFNFVWNNAPFLEARFNKGYSEALRSAIEGAEKISANKANWTKFLTSLVRSGDITAIIYGGAPLIRSEIAKGKAKGLSDAKAMEAAIAIFETATLNAQQSGLATSISQFQNSKNPFARLFLAFKNTSNQYFRKQVDAIISYQNGDIPIGQLAKTTMIYSVIQPILYVSAGFVTATGIKLLARSVGLRDDEEDAEELTEKLLNDIMVQLVVSPVNAIPLLNDAVRAAARKVSGQKVYKVFSLPLFNELETAIRSLTKEEISGIDYLKIAGAILEPITAAPVVSGLRYFDLFTGKLGKKKKDVLVR